MSDVHRPDNEAALGDIVAAAAAAGTPLETAGGGSKTGLGRPVQAGATLDVTGLSGITLYEPSEMVIAARAGTPLSEVVAALDEKNQHLTFEPMDYGALCGTDGTAATVGGVAACNVSGPRRILAGAARDSMIGVRFVNGRGEAVKSGGRVMKNVTGYDLVKLTAGAHGTLGVISEVTFKVLPQPAAGLSLVFEGLADEMAREVMSAALCSPFEVTGAAHLPAEPARTVLRLEGFTESIDYRARALAGELRAFGRPRRIGDEESTALWRDIRDARPLAEPAERAVWRVSTAPTRGPAVAAAIRERLDARHFYDWGGGLVWLTVPADGDAGAAVIRSALGAGGHATLIRAPEPVRAAVDVFQPPAEPVLKLTRGLKAAFDPAGILNPGRMHAGV